MTPLLIIHVPADVFFYFPGLLEVRVGRMRSEEEGGGKRRKWGRGEGRGRKKDNYDKGLKKYATKRELHT